MKKSGKKSGATRAKGKKSAAAVKGRGGGTPPRGRGKRGRALNYEAALRAVSKGRTLRNIALEAGSVASEKNLPDVGAAIVRRLRDRGRLQEAFDALGYTVRSFAEGVIEGTKATKISRIKVKEDGDDVIRAFEDIDTAARLAARDQYARSIGIYTMPLEGEKAAAGLESVSDEMLLRMAAGDIDPAAVAELLG
ncbi:MAG: hypothetical protein E6Q97_02665 [Desulfurellales bacterium]|nr:MAG: hypothetical protein E6Q97_02665 [Desulfurellales bacterium]